MSRRPDAEDRRRNVVELTDAGQDTLHQATKASDDAERALAGLSGGEAPSSLVASQRSVVCWPVVCWPVVRSRCCSCCSGQHQVNNDPNSGAAPPSVR